MGVVIGDCHTFPKPNAGGEQRPTLDEIGTSPKNLSGGPSAPVACSAWNDAALPPSRGPLGLFDLNAVAHQPQFQLLQTHFPALFELSHPLAVPGAVGNIYDDPHQVVPIENPTVTPVPFHFLRLVTGRPEVIDDFEYRLSDPFSGDVASIIEPEG